MNKPLLFTAIGVALFAAGYWTGKSRVAGKTSDPKQGPVAAAIAARASESAAKSAAASSEIEVRSFAAGRPFVRGGAKAWLLAIAAQLAGERSGLDVELVDMAQLFITMDEACAAEICEALVELLALREAGDPSLKAIKDGDDMGKSAYMLSVFRLSQLNPAAALDALRKLPKGVPDEATKFVFARLAALDPARAEAMVETLPENQRGDALEGIFSSLAGKNPPAALALAEKYPDKLSGGGLNHLLDNLIERDPHQGIATAVRLTEKGGDSGNVRHAFSTWLEKDRNAAMAWAAQHTGPGQTAVQALLLEQRAERDPQGAMQDFATLEPAAVNKEELAEAAAAITRQLADKDPETAQSWIATLPEGPHKDRAAYTLTEAWISKDPAAASEWIKTLPPGEVRDHSARELAQSITRRDPASAWEWAQSIQNEERRRDTMREVLDEWEMQDAGAAKAARSATSQ